MVLVHEAQGRRICLECQAVFEDGDEHAWMADHLAADGCRGDEVAERRSRRPGAVEAAPA